MLEEYNVAGATVRIIEGEDGGRYEVIEPEPTQDERRTEEEIMKEIYLSSEEDVEEAMMKAVAKRANSPESAERILYDLKRRTLYGRITVPMLDPDVEEIECSGPSRPVTVIHRRYSQMRRLTTNLVFPDDIEVLKLIERAAGRVDRSVSIAKPYIEISLPEGHRLSATISSEISIPGTTFDVRKFPQEPVSASRLIKEGTITPLQAAYLWYLMEFRPFIIVLGATGSGKTTLLNGLLNLLDPRMKIVTIEETPELNLRTKNWVRLIARMGSTEYKVDLSDLARLSLRYRPDYMVIGEVRGREIEALVHASASGHGSLTTFHGARPTDAVTRILDLLDREVATLFLQNIWVMPVMAPSSSGERRLSKVYEAVRRKGKVRFVEVLRHPLIGGIEDPSVLVEKSPRLRSLVKDFDLREAEVTEELKTRSSILSSMVSQNLLDQDSLSTGLLRELGRRKGEAKVHGTI
ncbi:type II/IV secretion system ATPase subunit [Sulfodiicoccus acidiphilus]|uniref:type II/IV secretion system ATPase subunit n=1 Tax=Sulfodiicoccus acidiphilus TaxID=1670455 RepID=UPI000F84A9CE|nr:type II/IV secretion system ATPase subunit [Sulfodiicoccus acidiphilus]